MSLKFRNHIKSKFNTLIKSGFFIDTAKLSSGTTLAQLIAVGTAPILYRIYEKEDYGTLGYFMAIAGVIGAISTLQYVQTIMIEENEKEAQIALWLNRLLVFFFSIIVFLIVLMFNESILLILNAPVLSQWLFLLPVFVFFLGQHEIYKVWANRKKNYTILSQNSILTAILIPVISIPVGLMVNGPLGLFLGYLASQIVPTTTLALRTEKSINLKFREIKPTQLVLIAKKYKRFPIYNLPSDFINRISNQLPVFMLGQFVNVAAIGVYNLCARILGLPISLISNAISEVFKQRASQSYFSKGSYHGIFKKVVLATTALTIVPTIICLLFAPDIFAFFFGEDWRESGILSQYLIVYFMIKFIVSPVSYSIFINNKLQVGLLKNIISLLIMLAVFYAGFTIYELQYISVLGIFGIAYALLDIFYLYYLYNLSRSN